MQTRTWNRIFVMTVLVIMTVIVSTNYIVNPYNVFRPNHDTQFNRLKTEIMSDRMTFFYELNHVRPQTLMVGTSRIGYFKSNILKPYAPSPIFNLTLAGSSIYEQSRYIDYAIAHLPLKTIVWSLDFFSFNPTKGVYPSFVNERLENTIYLNDYSISLLSYRTFEKSLKTLKVNRKKGPFDANVSEFKEQHIYVENQGQTLSEAEVRKNTDYTLHEYANHKDFLSSEEFRNPHSIDPKLSIVAETLKKCRAHGIQCIIYTSPVYREHLDMIYSIGLGNTYEYWKIGIADITEYWDFNTYNSITDNMMNFRDSTHIVSDNGKLLFAKIFNDPSIKVPKDFGIRINSENVKNHIVSQRKQIHPSPFRSKL